MYNCTLYGHTGSNRDFVLCFYANVDQASWQPWAPVTPEVVSLLWHLPHQFEMGAARIWFATPVFSVNLGFLTEGWCRSAEIYTVQLFENVKNFRGNVHTKSPKLGTLGNLRNLGKLGKLGNCGNLEI